MQRGLDPVTISPGTVACKAPLDWMVYPVISLFGLPTTDEGPALAM